MMPVSGVRMSCETLRSSVALRCSLSISSLMRSRSASMNSRSSTRPICVATARMIVSASSPGFGAAPET